LFLADYWHDPGKVVAPGQSQTAPADSNASSGADAGQPSLLDSDALNPLGGSAGKSSQSNAAQRPFVDPTLSKVPQINLFDSYSSGSTGSGLLGSGAIDPLSPTQANTGSSGQGLAAAGSTSLSPLQSALNRSALPSGTATAGTTTAKPDGSTDALSDSSTSSGATGQAGIDYHQSGLSSHSVVEPSQPSGYQPYVPQTSPAAGTTGYTVPPAFRTTTNTPSFGASSGYGTTPATSGSSGSGYGSTGYGSTDYGSTGYGAGSSSSGNAPSYSAPSTAPEPSPFSVPNTPPGRYTGGGQINTFSNP
jgi:hypothetical protein